CDSSRARRAAEAARRPPASCSVSPSLIRVARPAGASPPARTTHVIELLQQLIHFIRDPAYLAELGYPTLALVIFVETGLLVFFLPGDSLLVTAGVYAA